MLASDAVDALALVGIGSLAAYLLLLAVKYALCQRAARPNSLEVAQNADVTILQPILSGDPFLEAALRQNLEQAPPGARFLWLIDADDSAADRITAGLVDDSAGRATRLVCPPITGAVNPKTAKLQEGLACVTTPYVAVLDDDTILGRGTLLQALQGLRTCTLYTGLPCYLAGPNIWSALVATFVNNNSILTYLPLLPLVGPLTINGMFFVMPVAALRGLGGFEPLLPYLCDDYALAKLVKRHGGVIRQGTAPQFLRTTVPDAGAYFRLMHRWFVFANVLARDQTWGVMVLLFLFLGLPPLLLWLALFSLVGGPLPVLGLGIGLALRHLALRRLHREFFGCQPDFLWALSVLAELLQPIHWIHACLRHTVNWRTRRLRLERGGRFSYLGGPDP